MESSTVDTDWMEFFCKSGQLLFYYNKVTAEHRWPDSSNGYENGIPIFGRLLVCVATQTEDYGCSNGYTSVHVDGGLIQANYVDNEDLSSSHLDEDLQLASGENSNVVFDHENEFQVLAEVNADSSPESTTQSDVFDDCALIPSNNVENEIPLAESPQLESDEDVLPASEQSNNTVDGDGETQVMAEVTGDCSVSDGCLDNDEGHPMETSESFLVSQYEKQNVEGLQSTVTDDRPYECQTCGKRFTKKRYLKRHENIHTGIKPFECKTCNKRFLYNYTLNWHHEYIHTGKKTHECKTCGKGFTRQYDLKLHHYTHTGKKPYECKTCGRKFTLKGILKNHEYMHTGAKPYECKTCGSKFTWKGNLKQHEYIHTGIKPYECKTCGKRFAQRSHLKQHEYIHTGTKPYECKICNKRFRDKISLKQHEYVHAGEKPYECKACGKSFAGKQILALHELIHTGTKPHGCKTCGKSFTQKGVLKRHEYIHTGTKPYQCNTCGRRFTRKGNLKQHAYTHSRTKP